MMHQHGDEIDLINAVLQLRLGELHHLREAHLKPCTVHRYRDGWTVMINQVDDEPADRPVLGYLFTRPESIARFILGEMHYTEANSYRIIGERQQ